MIPLSFENQTINGYVFFGIEPNFLSQWTFIFNSNDHKGSVQSRMYAASLKECQKGKFVSWKGAFQLGWQ
jgi:hypothetical protein